MCPANDRRVYLTTPFGATKASLPKDTSAMFICHRKCSLNRNFRDQLSGRRSWEKGIWRVDLYSGSRASKWEML